MIGYPKDVKEGNWVRVGESRLWRRVKGVKRGKVTTRFTLEGSIPAWSVPTTYPIWYETHAGYARNERSEK